MAMRHNRVTTKLWTNSLMKCGQCELGDVFDLGQCVQIGAIHAADLPDDDVIQMLTTCPLNHVTRTPRGVVICVGLIAHCVTHSHDSSKFGK